jgi:elongation factor Ts
MYPHIRFIQSYVHHGRVGVLVEFGLETWMVTERPEFQELSRGLAMHIAGLDPESLDALLLQRYAKDLAITVAQALAAGSAQLGERISVTRFVRWINEAQRPPDPPNPPKDPAAAMRLKRA